jgi:NADH:ubiquinone reductase (H+-translocating)
MPDLAASASELPHVVIVGAGFGGLNAARALRRAPVRVTLIDKSNHHLFQPLLYQVATAGLSPGEIAAPIRHVLRGQSNTEVLMAEVVGVDKERRVVTIQDGPDISFDYLVIATGSYHSYFGHDEWEPLAPGLKSIADATNIRRRILLAYERAELEKDPQRRNALLTIAIVGGGPTGVEMAGSIAELAHKGMTHEFQSIRPEDTKVILVEANERVLASFPSSLSDAAAGELKRLGVEIRTNSRVEEVRTDGVVINGEFVPARTVMWAAGVTASPAAKWLGIDGDRAGRVPVSPMLEAEGSKTIFVIGDTASTIGDDGKPLPGLAPVAIQQGTYVAKLIASRVRGYDSQERFRYRDKGTLATIGRAFAVAQIGSFCLSGGLAWLIWVFVHIMYLIGFRNRLLVLMEWTWAYATYQRGVRLIVE